MNAADGVSHAVVVAVAALFYSTTDSAFRNSKRLKLQTPSIALLLITVRFLCTNNIVEDIINVNTFISMHIHIANSWNTRER